MIKESIELSASTPSFLECVLDNSDFVNDYHTIREISVVDGKLVTKFHLRLFWNTNLIPEYEGIYTSIDFNSLKPEDIKKGLMKYLSIKNLVKAPMCTVGSLLKMTKYFIKVKKTMNNDFINVLCKSM